MADGTQVWKDPDIGAVRALLAQFSSVEAPGGDWATRRAGMDAFGDMSPLPEGCEKVELSIGGIPTEKLTPAGADQTKALLFLHGGGYCVGSPKSHRGLAARLATEINAPALVPDYRMAPEHPFPAAVEDAVACYRHLLDEGVAPGRIAIAGDSAGGGLTLATALAIRAHGLPQPGCLFAISPWANLAQQGAAYEALAGIDPMLTKAGLDEFATTYLNGHDVSDPLASPALADYHGIAPLLIHAGGAEILASDAAAVAEKAGLAGVDVRLEIWPEMIHVWHAFFNFLSAGRRAISEASAWMNQKLG